MIRCPSQRELVSALRSLNFALDGAWTVALCFDPVRWNPFGWGLDEPGYSEIEGPEARDFGREELPGDGRKFDAVAAARRLLAAARDGKPRNVLF